MSDQPPEWFDRAHGYSRREDDGKTVELTGEIRNSTELAIYFYDGSKTVWIARSLITAIDEEGGRGTATITIPEWLAKKEGLI
jgi:hypothetical protein